MFAAVSSQQCNSAVSAPSKTISIRREPFLGGTLQTLLIQPPSAVPGARAARTDRFSVGAFDISQRESPCLFAHISCATARLMRRTGG